MVIACGEAFKIKHCSLTFITFQYCFTVKKITKHVKPMSQCTNKESPPASAVPQSFTVHFSLF